MRKPILLKDFLDYKFLSGLQYSPDGSQAVYAVSSCDLAANGYRHHLYLWDGKNHTRLTGSGDEKLFLWEDDRTILFASLREREDRDAVQKGEERTVFYRLPLSGGEACRAFSVPLTVTGIQQISRGRYVLQVRYDLNFSGLYLLNGHEKADRLQKKQEEKDYEVLDELPFYGNGKGCTNKIRTSLFLYESDTETLTPVSGPLVEVRDAKLNEDHSLLYYIGEDFQTRRISRQGIWAFQIDTGESRQLMEAGDFCLFSLQPWGDSLLVLGTDEKQYGSHENPWYYLLEDGKLSLLASYEDSFSSTVGSDCRLGGGKTSCLDGDTYYFITTRINSSHVYSLTRDGVISPVLEYPGSVDFMDISSGTILYGGMQDGRLQELYAFDLSSKERKRISRFNGWVTETKDVRPLEPCNFYREGTELFGWVIPPRDYQKGKQYPAILDIHGGPKTVYGEVFFHEMQVWANMGYFVFFMNPTGSDGRGNDFADVKGKYGTVDYDDLMAFTSTVLERYPDIDPGRLGVTGGSYGGFMTNWIIGHTDRFRAAASQRSIANWISMAHTSDIGSRFVRDQMAGYTWTDAERMWEHSPLKYAPNVKTPTLFIHSDEDFRCPLSEGLQMYSALVENGVEAKMCIFKGENHELSRSGRPKQRIRRLEEITDWMEKHLK